MYLYFLKIAYDNFQQYKIALQHKKKCLFND